MTWRALIAAGLLTACLSACATVPETLPQNDPIAEVPHVSEPIIIATPDPAPAPAPEVTAPPPPPSAPPEVETYELPSGYSDLTGWLSADHRPALSSFARGCASWQKADPKARLNPNLPEYGRYADWTTACTAAMNLNASLRFPSEARLFFEYYFTPVDLTAPADTQSLLTGYYEPEIDVRMTPDGEYTEPVLAKPKSKTTASLPRSKLSAASSRVIAYGRPIDVFFMQVQGSGRIKFADGRVIRAAYAGNNGKSYVSIGRVLVKRGELTLEQASKQSIEAWMAKAGPIKARALMNENPRYIFFTEQAVLTGEGPRGSMRVPLTGMGSLAVDSRYHPYGSLIWLETTLPQSAGDYRGAEQGILVSAQDSGNAIKGPLRGDVFFGSGFDAGEKAGVMKHPARWSLLLPNAIAPKAAGSS